MKRQAAIALVAFVAMAEIPRSSDAAKSPPPSLTSMSVSDRCLLGQLLARQMRDVLHWIDAAHVAGTVIDEKALRLVIMRPDGADGEWRSIFSVGETCAFELNRLYQPGELKVVIPSDPPPFLSDGQSYAVLFAKEIAKGRRWEFVWNLGATGYSGCAQNGGDSPDNKTRVCPGPTQMSGPSPTIKILVSRTAQGFEATRASLEFVTFEARRHHPDP